MADIEVKQGAAPEEMEKAGVTKWPVWTCDKSVFPWTYDEKESCYFLEGEVLVTPEGGRKVRIGKGDFVTFPQGMSCTWEVIKPVRKHYRFG
jgi:uncharacterized cupin superfamily protein